MTESIDIISSIDGAVIQHGPHNNRIYLMSLGDASPEPLVAALDDLAGRNGYTKIFAKVPASMTAPFMASGYRREAVVPGFFCGEEDAHFLGCYLDASRSRAADRPIQERVIRTASEKRRGTPRALPAGLSLRLAVPEDVPAMSRLYARVFPSYPFPIQDQGYLLETMASHVVYFAATHNGRIVALSSAEMDTANRNVEMTDFATHPEWHGRGLAVHLLAEMEKEMRRRRMVTAYTIARAVSFPMNITFAKLGYVYGGRLTNNTNIGGQIESMTIWHKPLGGGVSDGR